VQTDLNLSVVFDLNSECPIWIMPVVAPPFAEEFLHIADLAVPEIDIVIDENPGDARPLGELVNGSMEDADRHPLQSFDP
jgi:hypothetical protein